MIKIIKDENGAALLITLIVMTLLIIFGTVFLKVSYAESQFANRTEDKAQAYYIARAGAQSVAEQLIKGDEADYIIGTTSTPYSLGGGVFMVKVYHPQDSDNPSELNENEIYIESIGEYNDIKQTVSIMVNKTDKNLGVFNHTLYAIKGIFGGNLNSVKISGTIASGIDNGLNITEKHGSSFTKDNEKKVYDIFEIKPLNELPNKVYSTIPSSGTVEYTAGQTIILDNMSSNNASIKLVGDGVVNMYITGNNSSTFKGEIIINKDTQLHLYIYNDVTVTLAGSIKTIGVGSVPKIFIYGPKADIEIQNSTHNTFNGMIISSKILLSNKLTVGTEGFDTSEIYENISGLNAPEIGVQYRGYKWIIND